MIYDIAKNAWTVEIGLKADASYIDFFSNHRKTIQYKSKDYPTYISNPLYTSTGSEGLIMKKLIPGKKQRPIFPNVTKWLR